jgi:hypothetical protein
VLGDAEHVREAGIKGRIDVQLGHLSFKRWGHDLLAQPFEAMHLALVSTRLRRWYQLWNGDSCNKATRVGSQLSLDETM